MRSVDSQVNRSGSKETLIIGKVMQKVGFSRLIILIALLSVACSSSSLLERMTTKPAAEATTDANAATNNNVAPVPPADTATPEVAATEAPTPEPPATDTPLPPTDTPAPLPTDTPLPPTDTPAPRPTDTPLPPTATDTPVPVPTPAALFYNLPQAKLTSATGLYASPNRSEFIVPVTIPQGETVFIMGRNATSSHLRAVWNTGVGWVPVSFTDFIGQRERLQDLPVFEQEPPACAEPITTQFGFNSEWSSDKRQRIAVVADLFRSKYGPFPNSSLSLKINNIEVESSRRQIVENGQFSLKDVVFSPGQDLQAGETVGYLLNTTSDEPLTFMATIFSIPQNCQWEID